MQSASYGNNANKPNLIGDIMKTSTRGLYVNYILETLDPTSYGVIADTPEQKWEFLSETICSEYGFNMKDRGYTDQRCVKEWLLGLPSVLTVDFSYYDISQRLYKWGFLKETNSENKHDKEHDLYWINLSAAIVAECRKAGYPIKP